MSLKHGLLGLLNYGCMTGYELSQAFQDSLAFFWKAQTSQVYRELGAMEGRGWLTSRCVIQTEKPNKRVYTITNEGKAELQNWLSEPKGDIQDAMQVRSAFLMRVFFAGETGDEQAISLLKAFQEKCLESLAGLHAAFESTGKYHDLVGDEGKSKYWKIVALFGETFYRAEMEWAEKAVEVLEGKS